MTISSSIFKAYDIRGIVPTTVNEEVALRLGRAFGTQALLQGEKKVAVGRDGRLSGPSLADALIRGLSEAGVEVIDVGMVTTPMLYFAASTLCASGIQVTGSHNPRDYNGFKMVLGGRAIFGDDIQALRHMMVEATWKTQAGGSTSVADVRPAYQARIQSDIHLQRPIKIVVDSGNGVAGASAPDILRSIGCEVIELYSEVDGNFPNHHPDPSKPENLRDLVHALRSSNAELPATVPTELQLVPPLVEYSHEPLPLVVAVIAMPSTAAASTSVIRSPPALLMIEATVFPLLEVSSSVIVVRLIVPVLSSTGASLTLATAEVGEDETASFVP